MYADIGIAVQLVHLSVMISSRSLHASARVYDAVKNIVFYF